MNFVFWLVIVVILALVWITFTGVWSRLGDWLENIFENAKEELEDTEDEY